MSVGGVPSTGGSGPAAVSRTPAQDGIGVGGSGTAGVSRAAGGARGPVSAATLLRCLEATIRAGKQHPTGAGLRSRDRAAALLAQFDALAPDDDPEGGPVERRVHGGRAAARGEKGPTAQGLLVALWQAGGQAFTLDVFACLQGTTDDAARSALKRLANTGLVQVSRVTGIQHRWLELTERGRAEAERLAEGGRDPRPAERTVRPQREMERTVVAGPASAGGRAALMQDPDAAQVDAPEPHGVAGYMGAGGRMVYATPTPAAVVKVLEEAGTALDLAEIVERLRAIGYTEQTVRTAVNKLKGRNVVAVTVVKQRSTVRLCVPGEQEGVRDGAGDDGADGDADEPSAGCAGAEVAGGDSGRAGDGSIGGRRAEAAAAESAGAESAGDVGGGPLGPTGRVVRLAGGRRFALEARGGELLEEPPRGADGRRHYAVEPKAALLRVLAECPELTRAELKERMQEIEPYTGSAVAQALLELKQAQVVRVGRLPGRNAALVQRIGVAD